MSRTDDEPRTVRDARGSRIEYTDLPGDPARAPLVLLHEGLGSLGLWRDLPDRLAAASGRRTVAYSRFGHGYSDPPPGPRDPGFMHHEATVVLPELLARWEIERPVLVGHSDGASIALLHAAAHPVGAVAVLAPHLFVEDRSIRSITAIRDEFVHNGLRERMAKRHRDAELTFRLWNDIWLDEEFAHWNIEREVAAITAPVLAIQGADDEYGTLAQIEAIERLLPGTETLVLPGGHWPHRDHAERVITTIAAFVDRADRTERAG